MARKPPEEKAEHRGLNDVIGILLIAFALLSAVALFSFDRRDLPLNTSSPNHPPHNWSGLVGAYSGYALFFVFGAGAYLIPVLFLGFGLACFFELLSYLKRQWLWGCVLVVACMGLLDVYSDDLRLAVNVDSGRAGGILGQALSWALLGHFGRVGATILCVTAYLISLLYLTNFQLGPWLREIWEKRKEAGFSREGATPEELELDRRSRELQRQAAKLAQQVEGVKSSKEVPAVPAVAPEPAKSNLGADMKPVPEPMVRDLSVPSPRPRSGKTPALEKSDPDVKEGKGAILESGGVITAKEIEAATVDEVLGRKTAKGSENFKVPPNSLVEPEPLKSEEIVKLNATVSPSGVESTEAESSSNPPLEPRPPATPEPVLPPPRPKLQPRKPKPITVAATPMIGNYQLPTMEFLQLPDMTVRPTESREELMAHARLMQSTLAQFDIEVSLGDITKGPTITRYELHPAPGVKLEKISALTNNIAAALKAERIHILAPVPGKSSVGIEVPNLVKTKVIMRDLLESPEWQNSKARIPLALGKDVYGHPIIADLAEMPHLLIAGSTGSGKSVCINSIIASLVYKFSPDQLRFVMIDPKVVELQQYNALPHLVVPVVTDPKKVILALRWVVNEMEKRYKIFARVGVRNIKSFNDRPKDKPMPTPELELPLTAKKEKVEAGADGFAVEIDEEIVVPREEDIIIPEKLSYVVVIIDELADLMLVAPADVEMAIARITQMARAAGIHCIVATQRPSVDVITGVIKANIPARIAFQVASRVDSRTILDAMGADKLLGKGDMLYLPPGSARLIRAQGVLITDQEIQSVVDFIARQGKPSYEVEIHQQLQKPVSSLDGEEGGSDEDESLIEQCIEVIRSEQKASVSLLQRRLRLGYTRAARIMDELENRGIVGPGKGAEPRDILIDLDGTGADGLG